jgi:RHS repeat-associated protein
MLTLAAQTMTLMTRLTGALTAALLLLPAPARAQAEEVVYYHTDAIGSVRAITDATGAVIERYDFLPFGEALPSTVPETRQFAGKERDAETGLDYFGARQHMSATGRFTTVDPLMNVEAAMTDPQRWNRYAYALNGPFKFTDPDGRDPRLVGALIGTAVYSGWNAYVNVQQGRPWYENASREAAKGLVVGLSLGLAGPALASAPAGELGLSAGAAGATRLLPAISSSTIDRVVATGAETGGRQGTVALRALSSHSQRGDPAFQGVARTAQSASELIRDILQNPSRVAPGQKVVDVYNSSGQGVRFNARTLEFITFLDASKATR